MASEKIKIRDLAKELNVTGKRIVEKLAEIDIVKTAQGSLDADEVKALKDHIGYKEKPKTEDSAPSDSEKTTAKTEKKTTGVIMRRVVYSDTSSSAPEDSKDSSKKPAKYSRTAASSGLRQGYTRNEEAPKTAEKTEKEEKEETAPTAPAATEAKKPSVRRVRRVKPEEEKTEVPKAEEPKAEEPKTNVEAPAAEEKKAEPKAEEKKEETPAQEEKKPVEAEKPQEPAKPVRRGPQFVHRATEEERASMQNARAGRGDRNERSERGESPERGDRPQQRGHGDFQPRRNEVPKIDSDAPMMEQKKDTHANKNYEKKPNKNVKPGAGRQQQSGSKENKYKSGRQYMGGMGDDFDDGAQRRKNKKPSKYSNKVAPSLPKVVAQLTEVKLPESMTVKSFAETIKKTSADVIKKLMLMGIMASMNQEIDFDTAAIIASEFGINAEKEVVVSVEEQLFDDDENYNVDEDPDAIERPPVVVVMGHVDHGKTSLLDAIRSAHVTEGEAGGITQHIGAYTVTLKGKSVTFLDTPGHEAFTAMRARGAQVTDVAILVVAADDGVMPQTIESINHAKAAGVTIVVAVNKIDRPGANPDRVMQEMVEYGLVPEAWGGDTIYVPVSAKNHTNIDELLENLILSADVLGLKANPNRQAKGTIIEAKLDKNKGPVATLLVQEGTLRQGDTIISGVTMGHVRTMTNDKGRTIKEAGPSTPVEITGMPEVPEAGEVFHVVKDEKLANKLIEQRKAAQRENALKSSSKISLDTLFAQMQEGNVKELNIVVKADVQGSVEAVKQSLEKLSSDEVKVRVIHGAVGAITESDVTLAQVSNAVIIGFNVRPGAGIAESAENAGVDIRLYRVIYDAINDIKDAMVGMLDPEFKEVITGHVEVRQTFKVSGVGTIAGAYVTDGKIVRNSDVRIVRDGIVIFEGKLASLKRFKDDAKEVAEGFECGLSFEKYNDIKEGDVVECYVMEEIKRSANGQN